MIAVVFVPLWVGLGPETAAAAGTFRLSQITTSTTQFCLTEPATLNADGTRIAFASDCDLRGGNPGTGTPGIFLFNTATSTLTQVTTCQSKSPAALNADGTRIAFASSCNRTGDNPDGNSEIFLFNVTTSTLTQITTTSGCNNGGASTSLNADGTRIAFASSCNLTGDNPGGNFEIFLFNVTTNTLTQITTTTSTTNNCVNDSPLLSADGTRIVFESTCNLTGGTPDGDEIFIFDTSTSAFTEVLPPKAGCGFSLPRINADGTRITFVACNSDGIREIFLFDTTTTTLTQITNSPSCDNGGPTLNADGTRIVFESTCNLTGGSPDGDEIFIFDTATRTFTQVTTTGANSCSYAPWGINADGTRIAFASSCDLTGGNPGGYEQNFLASQSSAPAQAATSGCQIATGVPGMHGWLMFLPIAALLWRQRYQRTGNAHRRRNGM
jgi:Tol biopolymer transport system component